MPEYGRGIHDMVQVALSIEDPQERQHCAEAIIDAMSTLTPSSGNKTDNRQRLWNHLARLAHYKLDIEYPVEIVPEEDVMSRPEPLAYPMRQIRRRHYGHLVEQALDYLQTLPDGDERSQLTGLVANQMKQDLYIWNRDAMDNDLIAHDIDRYTDGTLKLDVSTFKFAPVSDSPLQTNALGKKKRKH